MQQRIKQIKAPRSAILRRVKPFFHAPGTTQIAVTNPGNYEVTFSVSGVEPGQFALFLNGALITTSVSSYIETMYQLLLTAFNIISSVQKPFGVQPSLTTFIVKGV
ncbi:hypothetical protein Back11_50200 [Paenibacillus baekrokdamisoli]|uniref:Uncharacterized protein n=1 Tax=Paenibacillus baekrokdamisoli TaxID=1712516 RepID=A0A3G9J5W5_9BACL|nr:hypothetical protein [Paenibacillus baekrokdamisoli]BBH23675.1 hypothetical protein Back11_50200 [Paenibacillus baekrokdamisoli]